MKSIKQELKGFYLDLKEIILYICEIKLKSNLKTFISFKKNIYKRVLIDFILIQIISYQIKSLNPK
jgi:hypothetical protein